MSDEEFRTFANRLFISFPNVSVWVKTNSPDPKATLTTWQETLSQCRLDECLSVVAEWIDAKRQPPTQYELHSTALIIRSRVMFDRDKDRKKEASAQRLDTYEDHRRATAQRRSNYQPLPGTGMLDAYRNGLVLKQKYIADGTIESRRQQFMADLDSIVEQIS